MAGIKFMTRRTECDVAMARSKGIDRCRERRDCLGCVACILIDEEGQRRHADDLRPNGAGPQPTRLSEGVFRR